MCLLFRPQNTTTGPRFSDEDVSSFFLASVRSGGRALDEAGIVKRACSSSSSHLAFASGLANNDASSIGTVHATLLRDSKPSFQLQAVVHENSEPFETVAAKTLCDVCRRNDRLPNLAHALVHVDKPHGACLTPSLCKAIHPLQLPDPEASNKVVKIDLTNVWASQKVQRCPKRARNVASSQEHDNTDANLPNRSVSSLSLNLNGPLQPSESNAGFRTSNLKRKVQLT